MPSPTVLYRVALAGTLLLGGFSLARPPLVAAEYGAPDGVLLLGTGANGVFRSIDSGQTWQPAKGLPDGGVWQVLADPASPDMAYAATGSLFRSADAGQTWQLIPGLATTPPGFTALTAQGALVLAAGTDGLMVGGGKRHWVPEGIGTPGGPPRLLLAAGPHLIFAVGTDGHLYLHVPAGTWRPLHGLPDGPITAFTDVPQTARANGDCMVADGCVNLYAAVAGKGVYQSVDSGQSWTHQTGTREALPADITVRALLQSGSDQCTTYAAVAGRGLYRFVRCGQFWKPAQGGPFAHSLTITALTQLGRTIVAATMGQGVQLYRVDRGGLRWLGQAAGVPADALGVSLAWLPPPPPLVRPASPLSRHCARIGLFPVCDPFLRFYRSERPPGVVFGMPLSPLEYDSIGSTLPVQYFDRARFEFRPDLPGKVHLTPLGRLLTLGRHFPRAPVRPLSGATLFPQTGYSIGKQMLKFWRQHGGVAVLGYPISALVEEPNGDGSGRSYLMQYFENARMEFHPEQSGTHYSIELGLLGQEYLCKQTGAYCHT